MIGESLVDNILSQNSGTMTEYIRINAFSKAENLISNICFTSCAMGRGLDCE